LSTKHETRKQQNQVGFFMSVSLYPVALGGKVKKAAAPMNKTTY
jgi:hypothetical protein